MTSKLRPKSKENDAKKPLSPAISEENTYKNHPYLLAAEPGETGYTQALRNIFSEIITTPKNKDAIREWEELKQVHLAAIPAPERKIHEEMLTPRILLGGIELSIYGMSMLALILFGILLVFLKVDSEYAAAIAAYSGLILLGVLSRRDLKQRKMFAEKLGITLNEDTSRHGKNGIDL